ncbi:MAG: entericidin [Verrucomicrobia bacterium]|nr:MAG: entericidin [Verrucomicrobiota bacterium]
MKYVLILTAALALSGCNTMIGVGRDSKSGFFWTVDKIHNWHHSD